MNGETLSPLDAMFLELEEADEGATMHIGSAMVFEPLPGGGAPALTDLRREMDARVHPRYRQRLSSPRTGGLHWPSWEEVDGFAVADNIHHAVLPSPGSDAELCEWLADFWSHRLDRTRPLWEMFLLEGLAEGRWAVVHKVHHCMLDGVGGVDAGQMILDSTRSGRPAGRATSPPTPITGAPATAAVQIGEHNGDHPSEEHHGLTLPWWTSPGLLLRGVRAGVGVVGVVRHPERARATVERARAAVEMLIHDELIAAPKSSLNAPIGSTRRYEVLRFSLRDLKLIRSELGGTINDVALAVATGGLRQLLLHRGDELPPEGLRGQIPVNIRSAEEALALGNRLTSLFVRLPVAEPNPLVRYAGVLDEAESRKHSRQSLGAATMAEVTGHAPPMIHTHLAQSLFDDRLFNLTITNVPGPRQTLYSFGAELVEMLPLVPLFARHSVGISFFSYAGDVMVGLNADRDRVPDLAVLAEGMRESFDELMHAAAAGLQGRADGNGSPAGTALEGPRDPVNGASRAPIRLTEADSTSARANRSPRPAS